MAIKNIDQKTETTTTKSLGGVSERLMALSAELSKRRMLQVSGRLMREGRSSKSGGTTTRKNIVTELLQGLYLVMLLLQGELKNRLSAKSVDQEGLWRLTTTIMQNRLMWYGYAKSATV